MISIRSMILGPLVAIAFSASAFAEEGIRFFNPGTDVGNTLRVCYQVSQVKKSNSLVFEVTRHYTGGNKLDPRNYGPLPETETVNLRNNSELKHLMYAFTHGLYACEISSEYNLYWVISKDEVTGTR